MRHRVSGQSYALLRRAPQALGHAPRVRAIGLPGHAALASKDSGSQLVPPTRTTEQLARLVKRSGDAVTLELDSQIFDGHLVDPAKVVERRLTFGVQELLDLYREMFTVRRMEMAADMLYKQRAIRGFCHLDLGQEAIASGVKSALTPRDMLVTAYRDHAQALIHGGTLVGVLAELLGRQAGHTSGKGGSMHFYNRAANFFGGHGIVGAQVPLGTGLAFAAKYNGEDAAAVVMYGDGAANQGQIFESYNMAALWSLPAIFMCENNMYGMGTSVSRASAEPRMYMRGHYIPGLRVDAMNVLAVRQAVLWARSHAVSHGPVVLECRTYRYSGHSMSDPGTSYRTRDEVKEVRGSVDPVARLRDLILHIEAASPEEMAGIDDAVKTSVKAAVAESLASPPPEPSELVSCLYPPKSQTGRRERIRAINAEDSVYRPGSDQMPTAAAA